MEIVWLVGDRIATDDSSLAVFVDEYIIGMDVPDFLFKKFEFITCSHKIIKHVPNFCFFKIFAQVQTVLDLATQ